VEFKQYQRRQKISDLRPYVPGEDLSHVSISPEDEGAGSPKEGDMIARNPKNHYDKWLVASDYFADNFDPEPMPPMIDTANVGDSASPSEEQGRIILETMQSLLRVYNGAPDELKATITISFIVTMFMSTGDPWEAYNKFGPLIAEGIVGFQARRANLH
jgi:hypothetical protein